MRKKVLIPTDFSDSSLDLVMAGVEFFALDLQNVSFTLIASYELPAAKEADIIHLNDQIRRSTEEQMGVLLEQVLALFPEARMDSVIRVGDLARLVPRAVASGKYNFLVTRCHTEPLAGGRWERKWGDLLKRIPFSTKQTIISIPQQTRVSKPRKILFVASKGQEPPAILLEHTRNMVDLYGTELEKIEIPALAGAQEGISIPMQEAIVREVTNLLVKTMENNPPDAVIIGISGDFQSYTWLADFFRDCQKPGIIIR